MSETGRVEFSFELAGKPGLEFHVLGFSGRASLNGLYGFSITAIAPAKDVDALGPEDFFSGKAKLGLRATGGLPAGGGGSAAGPSAWAGDWHGVLTGAAVGAATDGWTALELTLEPELSRLRGRVQTRIHLDESSPDAAVESVLYGGLDKGGVRLDLDGPAYPKREFALQYGECLLGFVMRTLERDGLGLRFDQSGGRDVAVVTDSNSRFPPLLDGGAGEIELEVSGVTGTSAAGGGARLYGARRTVRLPKKSVKLRDYDWRRPSRRLEAGCEIDPRGRGELYLYGENFRTAEEGRRLARIRRDEELWASESLSGSARLPGAMPGMTVKLKGSAGTMGGKLDGSWLIASEALSGRQAGRVSALLGIDLGAIAPVRAPGAFPAGARVPGQVQGAGRAAGPGGLRGAGKGPGGGTGAGDGFACRLVLGRADLPYRPARTTPRPKVEGTVTAWIDGAGSGETPEMDAWGRYKVLFPFDISGRPNGRASPWIRMSQPYTGAGYGQHFPLAPGCEVQVAFTDGDPDRPVITGAVPNAETGSLVNSACPNSSGIGTRGGGSLVFGEVPGKQSATLAGGSGRGAVTLTAGSPTVADVSADVVDSTHAVYGSANFFSGSNTSGGFHEVRASASWARTVSLISSTVRSAAEAASVAAGIAKDKPGTSGTACDIAANAFSLADFAVQPLMRFIQWCLESKKRKEQAALSAADPDWRGPPDDGLFSVEGDSEGCQSAWRANSDFSQGGWQKNLTVFVMVMNALRSAAAGAAGYVAGDDADADQEKEDGEEMEPAVKLSNRICAAGSGAAATLLEIVLLVKMANSFGNPSGKKPKGIHLHNRDSYVTILADTFGALSAKGPLVLESGGKARLGEDMVHETARGIGDLSRLASDENGKSGPGAFSAQNAVLLRGDLVRSMGETVSLGAAKEVAVKSARKIRIASGAVPAYAAPEAAKSALENASAEAKTLDAPAAFDSGISLEAIQDGSVARMCCLDREGAVLLLHGPHQGAKAEANGGSQGGRRLELSPNGALIQNDKDHMLKLSEGGGAELTDANGMSVKLANGEAALRKDGSCSMTLGNGKFSLAGNAGLEVTGGNASKIIMAADGLDLKSQGQLALNAKMTILG